jgi:hypothetical protein
MNPAAESRAVGSMEGSLPPDIIDRSIGGHPIVTAKFEGTEVDCLLDCGSMVTTISESYFKEFMEPKGVACQAGSWFSIHGANGLEIPYVGLSLMCIQLEDVVVPDVGVFVMKDTPETQEARKSVPGIIGTNVLEKIGKFATLFKSKEVPGPRTCLARIAGTADKLLPASSISRVEVVFSLKQAVTIEPLRSNPVEPGVQITPVLVAEGDRDTPVLVPIVNTNLHDVRLKKGTRIGLVHPVKEVLPVSSGIQINVAANQIVVKMKSEHNGNLWETSPVDPSRPVEPKCDAEFYDHLPSIDPKTFPGTEQELQQAHELFQRYSSVFVKEGEPLGCTPTIRHQIRTSDNEPVRQPFRRLPPQQWNELRQHLDDLLAKGIIKESTSNYSSPIVIVRKRNGT